MCGIFAIINPTETQNDTINLYMKGSHRGPDHSCFLPITDKIWFGFHRLAINGLNSNSNQPFSIHGIYLICNGEIYNHENLFKMMNITPTTSSDCEIIVHLYHRYGIEQTVQMIDASEFSFVLYDTTKSKIYAVRDPYGVRPLFQGTKGDTTCFTSEIKMMPVDMKITTLLPGTITTDNATIAYCSLPAINHSITDPYELIRNALRECVYKRVINTERPIACLLSGGLDSSLIATIVNECRKQIGITEPIETYSIGLEGSEDLKYAAIMANFLGSKHTSLVVSENDFLNAIPEVIWAIESRDTTTVRASVGNYLISKHIRTHSEAKVIFNGDGADEVCGGYLYMKNAPDAIEFDKECRRLVKDIHYFDALRSDRCISHHGLEARTPFLDRIFVEMYLSIPVQFRYTKCEKFLLRTAFQGIMPDAILWRKKEAFSDGVSSLKRSWYSIIQSSIPPSVQTEHAYSQSPLTQEQYYYKSIYDKYYDTDLLPYYWMPKYTTSLDCSARTLETYLNKNE
jgi:asparagine synthase (glutamine-hydrolysing)